MKFIYNAFLAISFLLLSNLHSKAMPVGWSKLLPIQIHNNVNASVTNYQARLIINTQTPIGLGQMKIDGGDIRFGKDCSGNILFNYWIESGLNTPNTVIWVKLDSLNALETRTFYMFYDNPSATATSAINGTFFGPNSATDSVSGGTSGGAANCQRGFRFSPNEDILVTDFGKNVPNATTRYVTLFDFVTQAIITQTQVAGAAGQYSYSSIPNPIWLTSGTQYLLEIFSVEASYYFKSSNQIGQHLTYYDMRYCNSCTQNTFPTSSLGTLHYGYPDLWYYTKTNLATPPTINIGVGGGGAVTFTATPSSICPNNTSVLQGNGAVSYNWQPGNFNGNPYSVSPNATTIYTITATTATGCIETNTLLVTVNPIVSGTGNATPNTICLGESSTINGTANIACPSPISGFANIYAPANWITTQNNSNGTINASGAPANIIISSGTNLSGNPGQTKYSITVGCNGTINFNWNYTHADAYGSIFDYPSYSINGGLPIVFPGFTIGGANSQNGNATINVNIGDVFEFQMYTLDNDNTAGFVNISNFIAPATQISGTVSIWDSPIGGMNIGAPTQIVTPNTTGIVNYYLEFTSNGPGNCVNPTRVAVPITVNALPIVTATPSTQSVCENGTASVAGGGANTYTWTGGITDNTPFTVTMSNIYTVTGTDGNGCTNTATAEVIMNSAPVVTATPPVQTICENGTASVAGGGANTYTWTGGITDNTPFTVTMSDIYIVTGTDGNGCTNTATAEVIMNSAPSISATATPSTTCDQTSVMPSATGVGTITWSGGLTNNVPFVALATTTYTATATDGNGCTATSTALVTVNPASGGLAPVTSNQTQNHGDGFDINYYDASCDLIATVDDGAGGNVLGSTIATVNVEANAGTHNGQPFVRRWYQITPSSNGTADVTLYINQSDFDDYNAVVAAPYLALPTTGDNMDANIGNIRITKNSDAGLGNSPIVITPTVNWNGSYWELSFNTPSFSQFRVHSVNPMNTPLPATVISFSGVKQVSSDLLSWTTASEQNNAYFNLQHSTDGAKFTTIAKVNSKGINGNSNVNLTYNAENKEPKLGHNYYRLEQVDMDGKVSVHAKVIDLIWGADGSMVSIYPNPTTDVLNIDLYAPTAQNTSVKVLDMSGRVVKQVEAKSSVGNNHIEVSLGEVASGLYTVQVYSNSKLTFTSKVRKND